MMKFRRRSENTHKLKWLILVGIILGSGFFFFKYYMGNQLEKANAALFDGNLKSAEILYRNISKLPLSHGRGNDGLGTIALLQGRFEDAKNHFQLILANGTDSKNSCVEAALHRFIVDGAYAEGEMFREFLAQWQGESKKDHFVDFAILSLGNFELAKARRYLSNAPETLKQSATYKRALDLADQYELNKEIPIVFDRKGEPLMILNLINSQYQYVTPQLFAGWPSNAEGGSDVSEKRDWKNHIFSTIDLDLQRVAHQSMKNFEGSMIIMDPHNGDVLAAYGTKGYSPFQTAFEPGSVIKILTYATHLENKGNPELYAPKKYPGNMAIDGRLFYDWKTHGQINSLDDGMAVSCNLMFAQMGIDQGWAAQRKTMTRFLDRQKHAGLFGDVFYGELPRAPKSDFDLGRLSIGLDEIRATVSGLVQIPAAVANQGMKCEPRFFLKCTNIMGEAYREASEPKPQKVFQPATAKALLLAMRAAMKPDMGTARRAAVDGIDSAMKTGTAGERPFDSIMIGILNPTQPKIVFAFYLAKGGKCEINGAAVAARLQAQLKVIAPQYLE